MKSSNTPFKAMASLLCFFLVSAAYAQQVCITIKANPANSVNADVLSSSPTITNPSPEYFQAEQWTYGGVPGESRDLLKFDLSSIPAGSVIVSASLNLYADTNSTNGAMQGTADASYLLRVTSAWNANTVTWATQPTTTTAGEVLLAQSTSANENYLNLNVVSFIQAWVDTPAQNYGIMSQMITPNHYNHMIFCSGNHPDSSLRPTLMICYIPAPTCITYIAGPTNSVNADVLSSSPGITNTSTDYFQAEQWTYGGIPGESRDLMKFDLSVIPTGSIIQSATLDLYADTNSTNGAMQGTADSSYLVQITSTWDPNTVTWATQPTTTTAGEILLHQSTSPNENYLNLDVAGFVQSWVNNPAQNYGIMSKIITPNHYNHMIFCSGNYSDSTLRPHLSICYSTSTGIDPVSTQANGIVIYPNPNNGRLFHLQLPDNMDVNGAHVTVYDMTGREMPLTIIDKQTAGFTFSLGSEVQSGVYMVGLTNEDRRIYQKVLVSK
jgi:hypothetical protein